MHEQADKSSFELFRGAHGRNADIVGKFGPTSKEGSLDVAKALGMAPNVTWAHPLYVYGFGWMKVYLQQENYHAVYIPREDLNLDVESDEN